MPCSRRPPLSVTDSALGVDYRALTDNTIAQDNGSTNLFRTISPLLRAYVCGRMPLLESDRAFVYGKASAPLQHTDRLSSNPGVADQPDCDKQIRVWKSAAIRYGEIDEYGSSDLGVPQLGRYVT